MAAQGTWVTAVAWTNLPASPPAASPHAGPDDHLILATGSCDGSIRLLSVAVSALLSHRHDSSGAELAVQHCGVVRPPDLLNVHCLSLRWMPVEGAAPLPLRCAIISFSLEFAKAPPSY